MRTSLGLLLPKWPHCGARPPSMAAPRDRCPVRPNGTSLPQAGCIQAAFVRYQPQWPGAVQGWLRSYGPGPQLTSRASRSDGTRDTIWFRPIRTLLDWGVPAMPITYLLIDVAANRSHPIGALCKTDSGRLILWPLLTTRLRSRVSKDELIYHITLELLPQEEMLRHRLDQALRSPSRIGPAWTLRDVGCNVPSHCR